MSATDESVVDGMHWMKQGEPCFLPLLLRLFDPINLFTKASTCSPGALYTPEHTPGVACASGCCGRQW